MGTFRLNASFHTAFFFLLSVRFNEAFLLRHRASGPEDSHKGAMHQAVMLNSLHRKTLAQSTAVKPGYVASGCQRVKICTGCKNLWKLEMGMTLAKCFSHCRRSKGVKYFGVTEGSKCFCSEEPPGVAIGAQHCAMECSGSPAEYCGGMVHSASVFTMINLNCDGPSKRQQAVMDAAYQKNLLDHYASFRRESCGQAAGNRVALDNSPIKVGTVRQCMFACWAAYGAEKCHGFTYDARQAKCTFHLDVLDGQREKNKALTCYYKVIGFKPLTQ